MHEVKIDILHFNTAYITPPTTKITKQQGQKKYWGKKLKKIKSLLEQFRKLKVLINFGNRSSVSDQMKM